MEEKIGDLDLERNGEVTGSKTINGESEGQNDSSFNKKNYRNIKVILQPADPTKYTVNKYYVNPQNEETTINEANNCLTIPIMKFLDNLSNNNASELDFKPTKFIMMCMVRQEERYCDQTFETLEFANNVKSS